MLSAIIGNLVGDYLLQNDWMALNKKKSSFHCAVHCLVWTVCVLAFSGVIFQHGMRPVVAFWILFATHFLQDRTQIISWYMDLIGQKSFRLSLAPWSGIFVDNVWHIVAIWVVWTFVLG